MLKIITETTLALALFLNAAIFIFQAIKIVNKKTALDLEILPILGLSLFQIALIFFGFSHKNFLLSAGGLLNVLTFAILIWLILRGKNKLKKFTQSISLEEIISQLPGHVYWKDREGVFLGGNTNNWKDFGLQSLEDYKGKTDYDLFSSDIAVKIRQNDKVIVTTGKSKVFEEITTNAKGQESLYLSHKIPLYHKNKSIIGLLGVSLDITHAKKVERERLDLLENIIAIMPGHVYWVDRQNIYLGCNNNQARSAGLSSRKEIIGKRNIDLPWNFNVDTLPETLEKINEEVMETGKAITLEEPVILNNGQKATFLANKVPIKNSEGKIIGMVSISIDITELKEAELAARPQPETNKVEDTIVDLEKEL